MRIGNYRSKAELREEVMSVYLTQDREMNYYGQRSIEGMLSNATIFKVGAQGKKRKQVSRSTIEYDTCCATKWWRA